MHKIKNNDANINNGKIHGFCIWEIPNKKVINTGTHIATKFIMADPFPVSEVCCIEQDNAVAHNIGCPIQNIPMGNNKEVSDISLKIKHKSIIIVPVSSIKKDNFNTSMVFHFDKCIAIKLPKNVPIKGNRPR